MIQDLSRRSGHGVAKRTPGPYGSITLVLLDADPLADIHNTTKISEVFCQVKNLIAPRSTKCCRKRRPMRKLPLTTHLRLQ